MIHRSHSRTTPLAARLVALVLVCAFVLQSAARAGSGCVARVFTGECCCVAVDVTAAPSCCASMGEEPPADPSDEPRVESESACACASLQQPIAPVAPHTPDVTTERSWERILFAQPIASPLCVAAVQHVEQRALDRPPRPDCTFAASLSRTRLAQRGVAGLLSELCTLHR